MAEETREENALVGDGQARAVAVEEAAEDHPVSQPGVDADVAERMDQD